MTWLILDTETTGIDLQTAQIVELGAVVMQDGRVVGHRSEILDPGIPIPPASSEIHGITDDVVRNRRKLVDVADGLLAMVREAEAVISYNGLGYDWPLLSALIGPAWDEAVADRLLLDPLIAVRDVDRWERGTGRHRLTVTARRRGLDHPEPGFAIRPHRAAWDCVIAGRIAWQLREWWPVGREMEHQAEMKAAQDKDFQDWLAKQPRRDSCST